MRLVDPARIGRDPWLSLGHPPYGSFRRLVAHLRTRTDDQTLDLRELAGFCRNCLARWYREAAEERGLELDDATAREMVYGMPYPEWKSRYQRETAG